MNFESDTQALNIITKHGFTYEGGMIRGPGDKLPKSKKLRDAIGYLCAEWDYAFEPEHKKGVTRVAVEMRVIPASEIIVGQELTPWLGPKKLLIQQVTVVSTTETWITVYAKDKAGGNFTYIFKPEDQVAVMFAQVPQSRRLKCRSHT